MCDEAWRWCIMDVYVTPLRRTRGHRSGPGHRIALRDRLMVMLCCTGPVLFLNTRILLNDAQSRRVWRLTSSPLSTGDSREPTGEAGPEACRWEDSACGTRFPTSPFDLWIRCLSSPRPLPSTRLTARAT